MPESVKNNNNFCNATAEITNGNVKAPQLGVKGVFKMRGKQNKTYKYIPWAIQANNNVNHTLGLSVQLK